jgi:hypothetical protein
MGLKKRRLSSSSAANQVQNATKDKQLEACEWSAKRKALGFFGHVTEQASG